MLTKNEFLVLRTSLAHPRENQRTISDYAGISLGGVNQSIKTLQDKGLICNGTVTGAGIAALAPYKVDNAIIMAAGLSSRFAPISYEKPLCRTAEGLMFLLLISPRSPAAPWDMP